MKQFKNKFRNESIRLPNWNYAWDGYYFVTICTKDHECFFGEIVSDKMILSEIGLMVKKYWHEIPNNFNNVILDEFVVMPNHIHGIIVIDNHNRRRNAINRVPTTVVVNCVPAIRANGGITGKHNPMLNLGSLSAIIRSYKSICSHEIRKINKNFVWQPRFYEHIIRNEKSLNNIRTYIYDNPVRWHRDRNIIK